MTTASEQTVSPTVEQALQQAVALHRAGRLPDALRLYRAILEVQPQHPDANHNLGALALQVGQPATGLPLFRAALEVDPSIEQYWLSYAAALLAAGQLGEAQNIIQSAMQRGFNTPAVQALRQKIELAMPDSQASTGVPPPAEINRLVALFKAGDYVELEKCARLLAEQYPDAGFVWKALGVALKAQGKEALYAMQKAAQLLAQDAEVHSNLGIALQDIGQLDAALASHRRALQLDADYAVAHSNLGNVLKDLGQLDKAVASYRRALELKPDYAEGHNNLGSALKDLGQPGEAVASYRRALELKPDYAEAHSNLGNALRELGQLDAALASHRRALQLKPDFAEAHSNLGNALKSLGQIGEAVASYRRALELKPDGADVYSNLGSALKGLGQLDAAAASYRRVLELKPDCAEAHNNLGNILQDLGQLDEALASCSRALQLKPDYTEALNNLGNILQDLGQADKAVAYYRRVLELLPDCAEAHGNLGNALKSLGQIDDAVECYRRALQIKPDFAGAHNNLGSALKDLGQLDDAVASYRRALSLKPAYVEAHNNLGNALRDIGQIDESVACYRQALSFKADFAGIHSNLLFSLNYHPDMSAEEIFRAYREFDSQQCLPLRAAWRAHDNDRNPARHLRVGYVSPDFRSHSTRYFLEPLLAAHDKMQVEVYAYADLIREDDMTARYRSYADRWIPTKGMSDAALSKRIRDDGIDILVDVAGHTANSRLPVFARKPAPVSVSWLGYGYTTGLSAVDYYLTDAASAPEGSENLFAEQPWRIATPAYAYRPPDGTGEVGPLPAQQQGYITFGTLTRSVRINHRSVRVWSEILKAVPDSRLVLDSMNFKDPAVREWVAASFARHGIDCGRLSMGFHSPPWDVLRGTDIGLDCFPHNSGVTLFETLYMGVPYITLAGRPSVGRLGGSILHGAGHPEWIAHSEDEYIARAVELASDVARLSAIRAALRGQMRASPLMDEAGFARKVEAAYRSMWQNWCSSGGNDNV
jgi:protein O-GlcNAc transferase